MPPVIDAGPVGVPPPTGPLSFCDRSRVGRVTAVRRRSTGPVVGTRFLVRSPIAHAPLTPSRVNAPGSGTPVGRSAVWDEERHVVESQTLRDLVRGARQALSDLGRARVACPADVDRFDWSADLLDELARIALEVGEAAATLAGGRDEDIDARARELATAIVRRRNDALIPRQVSAGRVACRS